MMVHKSKVKPSFRVVSFMIVVGFFIIGCRTSNFTGSTGVKKSPAPVQPSAQVQSMNLNCSTLDSTQGDSNPKQNANIFALKRRDSLKFSGEFCPKTSSNLNVVFILDQSGSMANNDPGNALTGCGRSKAVGSILEILKSYSTSNSNKINYGIINFSSAAQTITPLSQVTTGANLNSIVAGLRSCGQSGATNYRAAFDLAGNMLSGSEGGKIIYFITDGLPQYAGASSSTDLDPRAAQDGESSVAQLRSKYSDVIINAVYLGDAATENQKQDRINYLSKLTLDPNRVKYVDDSQKLAEEIKQFAFPSIQLIPSSLTAKLKDPKSTSLVDVKVKSFSVKAGSSEIYSFELIPFDFSSSYKSGSYQLVLDAKDAQSRVYNQTYPFNLDLAD